MTSTQSKLLAEFAAYAKSAPSVEDLMKHIVDELHENMTRYNWVGFYLVDPADPNYLIVRSLRWQLHTQRAHSARQRPLRRSRR